MFTACTKDNDNNDNGYVLSVGVEFNLLDRQGNDLLNSNNENSYSAEDMKLFYLINGELVLAHKHQPDIGWHNGIMHISETTPYSLKVFTNSDFDNYTSEENGIKKGEHIAYLQLNETDTDTIKTQWESGNHYFVNRKVWYNGKEKSQEINENKGFFVMKK